MARRAQVILLVEDEAELRYVFRTALVFDGFNVHEARDGYEAVRWLEQGTADLIVLDLRLPLIDGLAVVTASDEDVSQFDVEDVLRKPVTTDTLVDTVRRCLGVRH
jgi:CheY-like chemotaxis protein